MPLRSTQGAESRSVGLTNIKELIPDGLDGLFQGLGEPPYRKDQLLSWIYGRGVKDLSSITVFSKTLRQRLSEGFYIFTPPLLNIRVSRDGTRKLLLGMIDGEGVESVLIPDEGRLTLCISTQIGCALGCRFCLTGRGGLKRNLRAYEMMDQVLVAMENLKEGERITNIVLMGMGEPLANYKEVSSFLRLATSRHTWNFSQRRITLSTAGLPDGIRRLFREFQVNLAVSLNATTNEVRDYLMPINRRYPLEELLKTLRGLPIPRRRRITFEYVLIDGVNDSPEDAERLVRLLKGIPRKVNLIPFNPFPGSGFRRPPMERVLRFQEILRSHNIATFIRESKGVDISAACGLLRASSKEPLKINEQGG